MASVHFTSWHKQSRFLSTSNFIIGRISAVSMLMDCIIPWLTTRTIIYPRHWSCLPAPRCTMLSWSSKRPKVFIWKLPRQSWKRKDLIPQSTSIIRMTVVRMHPAVLHWVTSFQPRLALETRIHSWWIPGKQYRRATNRGCITTLLRQSNVRSIMPRMQSLPCSLV